MVSESYKGHITVLIQLTAVETGTAFEVTEK